MYLPNILIRSSWNSMIFVELCNLKVLAIFSGMQLATQYALLFQVYFNNPLHLIGWFYIENRLGAVYI